MQAESCCEPHHVQGANVRGCLMCSLPVCEACIIKVSFGKREESTFANRSRSLCPDCYDTRNKDEYTSLHRSQSHNNPRAFNPGEPFCKCTAKDGHLCLKCKIKQKSKSQADLDKCHGEGCLRTKAGGFPSKVCLWCCLRLPSDCNRATARREYDSRHLLARSLSTYERRTEEEIIETAKLDPLKLPQGSESKPWRILQTRDPFEAQRSESKPRRVPRIHDPFEVERQRELSEVSARRSLTAAFAEEERWTRSEQLRRADAGFHHVPPLQKRATSSAGQSSDWRDTDSVAPTLVENDSEEKSEPPK